MTIKVGASGGFIVHEAPLAGIIAASSNGTLLSITPPTGKRVRLSALVNQGASASTDITITVGSRTVVNAKTLLNAPDQSQTPNSFAIGAANFDQTSATCYRNVGYIPHIDGEVDEVVVISTTTPTVLATHYMYQIGE